MIRLTSFDVRCLIILIITVVDSSLACVGCQHRRRVFLIFCQLSQILLTQVRAAIIGNALEIDYVIVFYIV